MKKILWLFCITAVLPWGCVRTLTSPPAPIPAPPPSWKAVGNLDLSPGRADYSQIYISNNGTPYIAFSDYNNNESLSVMSFNGTAWVTVGGADFVSGAYFTSLYVYNNTPYVAFDQGGTAIVIMTFNGTSWVSLPSPNFATGFGPSISGYNGTPYVAYTDASGMAMVMDYTAGAWATVGNADFSPGGAAYLSLDARSGTPYVGFCDNFNNQTATVMMLNGGTWSLVGSAGFSTQFISNTHLFLDNGTPYFSYTDQVNGLGATVQKFNGTSWSVVGTPGISPPGTNLTAIAVSAGTPYLAVQSAYTNTDLVLKYSSGGWVTFGTEGFVVGDGQEASLAVNANGNPYLAYQDFGKAGQECVYEYH